MAYVKNINGYDIKDAEARDQIAALKEYVDRPLGRWIILGDSYNVDNRTDASGLSWGNRIIDYAGLTDSYSFGLGGAAFGKSGNLNMNSVLSDNISNVTDPETITDILVGSGYNEWEQTADNINSGIQSFISYAKTVCPNARVHIAFLGRSNLRDRNNKFPSVLKRYMTDAGLYGASYVTNSEAIIQDSGMIDTDGIHPTFAGLQQIAVSLASYVVGGTCGWYSGMLSGSLTPLGSFTINSNARVYSNTLNSVISILLYNLHLQATNGTFIISGADYVDIAEISRCAVMGGDDDFKTFKTFIYYKESATGPFKTGLLSMRIYRNSNNKLCLSARALPFGEFSGGFTDMTVNDLYTYKDASSATFATVFGTN